MRAAFTLAEVLVTLTILGILASIIVPNVIQQYQKRVTITKLKKAYATLEGAAANLAAATGCVGRDLACTGILDETNNQKFNQNIVNLMGLKIKQKPKNGGTYRFKSLNFESLSSKSQLAALRDIAYVYVDIDGIGYKFSIGNVRTKPSTVSDGDKGIIAYVLTNTDLKNDSSEKFTDINGVTTSYSTKIVDGRDVFQFVIYDNFIVEPLVKGQGGSSWPLSKLGMDNYIREEYLDMGCNPKSTINLYGNSCAAKIIKDGWKINY